MLPNRPAILALTLLVLLAGCRTYGEHGNEEAMYHQIHAAIAELEVDVERFEARRPALERTLTVDDLDRLAESRLQMLTHYREIVDRLSPRSGHRELRRIYGSIISDRQIIDDQIAWLEQAAAADTLQPMRIAEPRANYQVVPVFFHRLGAGAGMHMVTGDTVRGEVSLADDPDLGEEEIQPGQAEQP
jgi:hypothetical protein